VSAIFPFEKCVGRNSYEARRELHIWHTREQCGCQINGFDRNSGGRNAQDVTAMACGQYFAQFLSDVMKRQNTKLKCPLGRHLSDQMSTPLTASSDDAERKTLAHQILLSRIHLAFTITRGR
jgi:hypothetical protein